MDDWTKWIGATTGIAALVVSMLAYRRASSMKRLELRVEARKMNERLHLDVGGLSAKLASARTSRERINAASGQRGATERWLVEWSEYVKEHASIVESLPASDATFAKLTAEQLEALVVTLNTLSHRNGVLVGKLDGGLADDEKNRDKLRPLGVPAPRTR